MNKINPSYIIGTLVFVIFILYIKISNIQTTDNTIVQSIEQIKQTGIYSRDLKNEFGDKQKQVKSIKNILRNQKLLKSPHTLKVNPYSVDIQLHNLNSQKTNKVISKIINSSFFISSLKIQNADFNQTIDIKIKL
jgi:hypothetical protein